MTNLKTIDEIRTALENEKTRSAWNAGVKVYALELLDNLEESREYNNADMHIHPLDDIKAEMLNGASNWSQFSWGGFSLIYDGQIAERLCTPSELKKTRNGERRPNASEEWLDTQARALSQAYRLIKRIVKWS